MGNDVLNYIRFFCFFSFLLLNTFSLQASEKQEAHIYLEGNLDSQTLQPHIEALKDSSVKEIHLKISSFSGDLTACMNFARELHFAKKNYEATLFVYIDEGAIGPAALLPFLADNLTCSQVASWGDIIFEQKDALPVNQLRSQLLDFLDPNEASYLMLKALLEGMINPEIEVYREGKELYLSEVKGYLLSPFQETLVINAFQMRELGLISKESLVRFDDNKPEIEQKITTVLSFVKEKDSFVGHIYIGDHGKSISEPTWIYVREALNFYKKHKPAFILVEIDSPGGEVFAAQKISDALYEIATQDQIPTVAFINNWAISAGAMIAYSCQYIVTSQDGSMGAAEPVIQGGEGGMQTASEKINSALRTDFANRAALYGRNPLIAEAMVDKDLMIVARNGNIIKLRSDEELKDKGRDKDIIIIEKGKLLTLTAQQMLDWDIANSRVSADKSFSRELNQGKTVLVKETPLKEIDSFQEVLDTPVRHFELDWRMGFFALLSSPAISSLLMFVMMMGIYFELTSPGFGLPGSAAVACMFLVVLSNYSTQASGVLEIICLLVGICLLGIELFVIPGFGFTGLLGGLMTVGSLLFIMLPSITEVDFEWDTQTWNAAGEIFAQRLTWFCSTFLVGLGVIIVMAKYMIPKLSISSSLVLSGSQETSEGYVATSTGVDLSSLIGKEAKVTSSLRPLGMVYLEKEYYQARSQVGDLVQEGSRVIINCHEKNILIVKLIKEK
jgi:membrane-bound serine protease (ClpP class)